jgi:Protein of unknown function (DUF3515)
VTDPSPVALRIAAGLVAALVVGVVIASQTIGSDDPAPPPPSPSSTAPRTGPLALVGVDAPAAAGPECTDLATALPAELPNADRPMTRLPLAAPAPKAAAAWGASTGEPVVLRCGLTRPAELTRTSSLRKIDKVQWLPVEGDAATTWYVVDRPVYIALTVPAGAGTGPLQEISTTVAKNLKPTPILPR